MRNSNVELRLGGSNIASPTWVDFSDPSGLGATGNVLRIFGFMFDEIESTVSMSNFLDVRHEADENFINGLKAAIGHSKVKSAYKSVLGEGRVSRRESSYSEREEQAAFLRRLSRLGDEGLGTYVGQVLDTAFKLWYERAGFPEEAHKAEEERGGLPDPGPWTFWDYATKAATSVELGITASGFLVLAPFRVVSGDKIILPRGSKWPFLLRSYSRGMYKFAGLAYVHGIMSGELSREVRPGTILPEQSFDLE